ncbi:hypothetical protein AK812_SmicGene10678 [Symbiodinium microadriaticum]|uniref:Uncharacterized protein n=1 Tax=Symbiodinium microadriaticum TaxID=2951 RepID=A0A1Q9EF61_SYMMI|nr:hypothetical protein AK812_SmicGene10678 [Symbiodinium microadriaticum]
MLLWRKLARLCLDASDLASQSKRVTMDERDLRLAISLRRRHNDLLLRQRSPSLPGDADDDPRQTDGDRRRAARSSLRRHKKAVKFSPSACMLASHCDPLSDRAGESLSGGFCQPG